jgi:hypothetical protein
LIGTIGCAEATLAISKTAGAIPAGFISPIRFRSFRKASLSIG